ncbi:hypothetical protein [Moorella sp. ACPs]|uniref:hypothetical protein n=1 Tax=Neomoorella carbonis TaxID=3062783 RepID=UPI00324AFCB2
MESLTLTYLLAVAHITLYGIALLLTRYPVISIFHLALANFIIAFGVRPLLSAFFGGVTLYWVGLGWEAYNRGLLYQLIFTLFYVIGYLTLIRHDKGSQIIPENRISLRGAIFTFCVGLTAVGLIHILSRGAWLPTARNQTLTSVVPFGKILFPLAVIPLSVSLAILFILMLRYRRHPIIFSSALLLESLAFLLLSLLYQRGFILSGLILGALFYERFIRRFTYIRALTLAFLLLVLLFTLRPLAIFISSGGKTIVFDSGQSGLIGKVRHHLLDSPNFDNADVWPVVIANVNQEGNTLGSTFLAIPARFLTPGIRKELELETAVDRVNAFYWGKKYWETNFGFNINLPQELYLNFGAALMPLAFIAGMLTSIIDRWLKRLRRITLRTVFLGAAALAAGGFVGEPAGTVQWVTAYIALGLFLSFLERLRLHCSVGGTQ